MHQTNPRIPQFLSFGAEDLSPLSRWGLTLSVFFHVTQSHLKNLCNSLVSQIRITKMHLDEAQKAEALTALNASSLSEQRQQNCTATALQAVSWLPCVWKPRDLDSGLCHRLRCDPQLVRIHLRHLYSEGRKCQEKGGSPPIAGRRNPFSSLIPLVLLFVLHC